MQATDPIDSLLAIYDNPPPKHQAQSIFDENIVALDDHLKFLIETHSGTVTQRAQASLTIQCIILRNHIALYLDSVNPQTGRGN